MSLLSVGKISPKEIEESNLLIVSCSMLVNLKARKTEFNMDWTSGAVKNFPNQPCLEHWKKINLLLEEMHAKSYSIKM